MGQDHRKLTNATYLPSASSPPGEPAHQHSLRALSVRSPDGVRERLRRASQHDRLRGGLLEPGREAARQLRGAGVRLLLPGHLPGAGGLGAAHGPQRRPEGQWRSRFAEMLQRFIDF